MLPMMTNNYRNAMNWMPGFVSEFFNDAWPMREVHTTSPAMNVTESNNDYRLELAVPGTTKKDYNIQLTEDGNLMVTLEKKHESETTNPESQKTEGCNCNAQGEQKSAKKNDRRYLRREFSYQKFQQVFALPEDVECTGINANVTDGVLTIELPKKVQQPTPASRQIEIQ